MFFFSFLHDMKLSFVNRGHWRDIARERFASWFCKFWKTFGFSRIQLLQNAQLFQCQSPAGPGGQQHPVACSVAWYHSLGGFVAARLQGDTFLWAPFPSTLEGEFLAVFTSTAPQALLYPLSHSHNQGLDLIPAGI